MSKSPVKNYKFFVLKNQKVYYRIQMTVQKTQLQNSKCNEINQIHFGNKKQLVKTNLIFWTVKKVCTSHVCGCLYQLRVCLFVN